MMLNVAEAIAPTEEKTYPEGLPQHKELAYDMVVGTWDESQWEFFNDLIQRESGWRAGAQNPKSSAFGLGQFLNSTWKLVNCEKTTNPTIQIDCTIKYVQKVYTTPQRAIQFHNVNNWY